MTASSRSKGLVGEREVAAAFRAAQWVVRNLEGLGDLLAFRVNSKPLHVEVKRAERLKLPEWLAQAKREAAPDTVPVVCFRQNQGEWYACLPLAALVGMGEWHSSD